MFFLAVTARNQGTEALTNSLGCSSEECAHKSVLYGSMVAVAVEKQLIRAAVCRLLLEVDGPLSRKGHPRAELISAQHAWHMKKPASTLAL